MSIRYSFRVEGDTLFADASGRDENLEEVQAYGLAVIEQALLHRSTHILCDERNLVYQLTTMDTFAAAEFIAQRAPHIARIALVCAPQFYADANFWENVAVNRGLSVCAFKDMERAKAWLFAPPKG